MFISLTIWRCHPLYLTLNYFLSFHEAPGTAEICQTQKTNEEMIHWQIRLLIQRHKEDQSRGETQADFLSSKTAALFTPGFLSKEFRLTLK
jgi:hypothetical protein